MTTMQKEQEKAEIQRQGVLLEDLSLDERLGRRGYVEAKMKINQLKDMQRRHIPVEANPARSARRGIWG